MNYFPDKPWNVGDEFENETTGVVYRYDGTKWVATQDSDPLVEYLPLSGGTLTGNLGMSASTYISGFDSNGQRFNNLKFDGGRVQYYGFKGQTGDLATQGDISSLMPTSGGEFTGDVKFKDAYKLQMGGTYNNNIIDGKIGFTDNSLVPTLGYVKHAINALGDSVGEEQDAHGFRKLRFARDKDWNNLRPGEFGLMDKDNNYVAQWSKCDQVFFSAIDTDGNRLVNDENVKDYVTELGSAFSVFTSSTERPIMRLAPSHETLNGFVQMEYVKDLDIFWIGWLSDMVRCIQTNTNDNLSNGQNFSFHNPDLFV